MASYESDREGCTACTSTISASGWRAGLARELANVVSEPLFDIPGLVEPAREQCLDAFLRGRPPQRRYARIPPGAELDVGRQAGVDETLGVGDSPLVKPGDPGRQRVHVCVEFGIGQCA